MEEVIADRYEVMSALGEGALGEVFRVLDREDGTVKAVKLLKATGLTDTTLARFEREFRVIAAIDHSHIVRVYDFGVHAAPEGERAYFSMELLKGTDLDGWCIGNRPRTGHPGFAAFAHNCGYLFHQVADALATVHAAGIVHRDLKPANIIVRPGRYPRAKLLDFGHARDNEGENLTQTGTVLGTATYMPPEQAMGKPPAPAADLYGLGCVLYEALSAAPPFAGDSVVQVLLGHIQKPVPDPRAIDDRIPDDLAEVCMHLLAKDPAERPPDARAVADLLAKF